MANKKNITLEDIEKMREILMPSHPMPPSQPMPTDTFASFSKGLRENWIFVIAVFTIGFWLVSNVFANNTVNAQQQAQIDRTAETVEKIAEGFDDLEAELRTSLGDRDEKYNEIIRRIDLLQKDVEILKTTP